MFFWGVVQTPPRLEGDMKFPIFCVPCGFSWWNKLESTLFQAPILGRVRWVPWVLYPRKRTNIPWKLLRPEDGVFPLKMVLEKGDIHSCSGKAFNESPFMLWMTSIVETKWRFHVAQIKESLPFCFFGVSINELTHLGPQLPSWKTVNRPTPTGTSPSRSRVLWLAWLRETNGFLYVFIRP